MAGAAVLAFADGFGHRGRRAEARREPLGWTASAAELSAESGSWTFEVWVISATVTG